MCNPAIDCKFCGPYVEVCQRVKRAFPLPEEEVTVGRPRRANAKFCDVDGCGNLHIQHSKYCSSHHRENRRAMVRAGKWKSDSHKERTHAK